MALGQTEDMKPYIRCQDNNADLLKKKSWLANFLIFLIHIKTGRDDGDARTSPLQACRASGRLGIPAPMSNLEVSLAYLR